MKLKAYVFLVILFITYLPSIVATASVKSITVAVVSDGSSEWGEEVKSELIKQLNNLSGDEFSYNFPAAHQYDSQWIYSQAEQNIALALRATDVDVVIALGILSSDAAGKIKPQKPLIATTVIDPKVQGFGLTSLGTSGVKNQHYLLTNVDIAAQIERFKEAIDGNNIGVIADDLTFDALPFIQNTLINIEGEMDFKITPIQPKVSNMTLLADSIADDVDGVFVLPQLRLNRVQQADMITALNRVNMPSFSIQGRKNVEAGFLMGSSLIPSPLQIAKRLSVDMRDIALGRDAGELAVSLDVQDRLVLNLATARNIDFDPPFTLLFEAEVLNELAESGRELSLYQAVDESLKRNLSLAIANEEWLSTQQDTRIARSSLLPQLSAQSQWNAQDRDLAGTGPTRTSSLGLSLSQSIYSETIRSNYTSSQYLQEAETASLEKTRLDVMQSTAQDYLNVLVGKTELIIQKDNLRLTVANLERAQFRYKVGSTDRSEVHRFETELGNDRQSVTNAQRDYQQALNRLNQTLHRPIDEAFQTKEPGLEKTKIFGDQRLDAFLINNKQLRIFSGFLTEQSLKNAPELIALKHQIAAQDRVLLAAKRKRFVPDVDLIADVDRVIDSSGAQFDTQYDNDWSVGVKFSWTLYQGSRINAEQSQERIALQRLKYLYQQTADSIETTTRNSIAQAGASKQNIDYAQAAAIAAKSTLDLVTDSYVRGKSNYIDLIDAQSAYLNARLAAANNLYQHFIDLNDVQRAIGFFDFYVSPVQQDAWFEKLEQFAITYRKN